jgi:hypothetical protein
LDLLAAGLSYLAIVNSNFKKDNWLKASMFLGVAAAFKLWPLIFILIFLNKRNVKASVGTILIFVILSIFSSLILGYSKPEEQIRNFQNIFVGYEGQINLSQMGYSYSLSGLAFVIVLLVIAVNPIKPSPAEVNQALSLLNSNVYFAFKFALVLFLLFLILRSKSLSSAFLYCSSIALLAGNVSFTYRGSILVFLLILRGKENGSFLRYAWVPAPKVANLIFVNRFTILEGISWVVITAPLTVYYALNSSFSTASVLQPVAVLALIYLEFRRRNDEVSEIDSKGKLVSQ